MKGTGGATCGQLSIWDRMTRVKVLPLWRAPFMHVTSKEYVDGTGGTTWKAMREERPVTPNFEIGRAHV